eukprot:CAMPEP_0198197324 /NCGR_PEP_ID=MMETSP1445-20131203/932_1 /TAXON_ID=36898 /ORGANISM="Pyramimonas sp., Strain CCMP2087" /LENGTH=313 /DNA_ID=CAMNT_0043866583 /DNA_START=55 /DNA_END=996 /DNA_ORIENTATION=+
MSVCVRSRSMLMYSNCKMRVMLLMASLLFAHVPKAALGSVPAGKKNLREQHRQVLTGLVVPLTEGNFSSVISGDRHMLVEFMTPWCGHCKKLAPVWHEFAVQLGQDPLLSLNVAVGKVDADVEKALAKKYSIESFPTILHFPMRDRPTMYTGGRTLEAFMAYAARLAKPPTAQRIYAFDLMAREFFHAAGNATKQKEVRDRTARTAAHFSKSQKDAAEMYVKLMDRALSKSGGAESYFYEESDRIDRLIVTKLNSDKTRELLLRKAIVGSFTTDIAAPGFQIPERSQLAEGEEEEEEEEVVEEVQEQDTKDEL